MSDKPFRFEVALTAESDGDASSYAYAVTRIKNSTGEQLTLFKAATEAEARAWLKDYLKLSIEDRRKLRSACA